MLSVFQVFSAEKETLITTVVAYLESKDIAYMWVCGLDERREFTSIVLREKKSRYRSVDLFIKITLSIWKMY